MAAGELFCIKECHLFLFNILQAADIQRRFSKLEKQDFHSKMDKHHKIDICIALIVAACRHHLNFVYLKVVERAIVGITRLKRNATETHKNTFYHTYVIFKMATNHIQK